MSIQVVQIAERAGEEEVLADITIAPLDLALGFRPLVVNAASNFPKCAEVKFPSWRVSVISRPGGDQGLHFLAAVRGGVANVPGLAR